MKEEVDWLEVLATQVIDAATEVHGVLGPGYSESVYEESLAKEFEIRKIPFERQKSITLSYKGCLVGDFRPDFLIDKQLIVELKAVHSLLAVHTAQTISYLKSSQLRLALLINFNVIKLKFGVKRIIVG